MADEVLMLHVLRVARLIRDERRPYAHTVWFDGKKPMCLGGHMCFDPEFKRLGLKLSTGKYIVPLWGPKGDEWMAEDALAHLLGLTDEEALFLFGTVDQIVRIDDTLDPKDVEHSIENCIRRVQRVIDGEP